MLNTTSANNELSKLITMKKLGFSRDAMTEQLERYIAACFTEPDGAELQNLIKFIQEGKEIWD